MENIMKSLFVKLKFLRYKIGNGIVILFMFNLISELFIIGANVANNNNEYSLDGWIVPIVIFGGLGLIYLILSLPFDKIKKFPKMEFLQSSFGDLLFVITTISLILNLIRIWSV